MSASSDLAKVLECERDYLLVSWRDQVRALPSAKNLSDPALNDHMPLLFDELIDALKKPTDTTIPEAASNTSAFSHGLQRYGDNYDITEVVAEYNVLRGCIHDLAVSKNINLQGEPFHILNLVLDSAIGLAVRTYATQQALEVQKGREHYLSFVAHDLRTPLNAISIAFQILEKQIGREVAATVQTLFGTVSRNLKSVELLVEKVLKENTSSMLETTPKVELRSFELWPLVEQLVHDLHPIAGSNSCKILNQVPYDLLVYADASLLRRIFQNLIANAIRYTPQGEIKISAAPRNSDLQAVECSVEDTGAGIPSDRLGKIFDELVTDPARTDGLGLGLAIVKTFVEAHHGKVTVESTERVGSKFKFFLPGKSA